MFHVYYMSKGYGKIVLAVMNSQAEVNEQLPALKRRTGFRLQIGQGDGGGTTGSIVKTERLCHG